MKKVPLFLAFLLSTYCVYLKAQLNIQDSLVLVDIYNNAGGSNWNNSNWLSNNPAHTWYGVTVSEGRVVGLDFDEQNLTGTLVDLSQLEALTFLNLNHNNLEEIENINNLTLLKELYLNNNNLTVLPNISGLVNLEKLWIQNNQLTTLPDLSNFSLLKELYCGSNLISDIPDLSHNINLEILALTTNNINELPDLSSNTKLTELHCSGNNITKIPDISNNINLTTLDCSRNALTYLPDLSNNAALSVISCANNLLIQLPNLSNNIKLTRLACANNLLTELPNLANNIELQEIWCFNNKITSLPNLSNLTKLSKIYCNDNQLKEIPNISNLLNLEEVNFSNNFLSFEDLEPILEHPNIDLFFAENFTEQTPDTISLVGNSRTYIDSTYTLSIDRIRGTNTIYEWYKNDVSLGEPSQDTFLHISQVSSNDDGVYRCIATNPLIPEITQYSTNFDVEVFAIDSLGGVYYPDQFLIEYVEQISYQEKQEMRDEFEATVIDSCMCGQRLEIWKIPNAILVTEDGETLYIVDDNGKKKRIRRKSKVNGADFHYVVNSDAQNYKPIQTTHHASSFYKKNKRSNANIKVAILDTGLDIFNESSPLFPYRWVNPYEDLLPDDKDGNCYQSDVYGVDISQRDSLPNDDHKKHHGSHIAEIIKHGLQPEDIEFIAVKTHDKNGWGNLFNTVCGIYYAMEKDVDIINASWSYKGLPSEILKNAIHRIGEQSNTLFITSAGNDATLTDTVPYYPASYDLDNILSVMSIDDNDKVPTFSNYGQSNIDLAARGVDVSSQNYGVKNGTSFSTAYTSGFAARMLYLNPELAPKELKQIIFDKLEYLPVLEQKCLSKSKLPDPLYENFEWLDFEAQVIDKTAVVLDWSTLFEVDLDNFEVQRSFDNINFSSIGNIVANNLTQNDYQFEDDYTLIDTLTSYYRIKINEKSGSYHYSETKKILFFTGHDFPVALLENPIVDNLSLFFQEVVNGGFIHIYDISGRLVYNQTISGVTQTIQSVPLPYLVSGNYLIRIIANNQEQTFRFQKIKN